MIGVAIAGAGLQIVGGLFGASKQNKQAKEQNKKISQLMTDVANYRNERKINIQNEQLQNTQRNINVMNASGFEMNNFNRLNTWLETQNQRELELYDKETQLQLSEINAGRPVTPSSFATGLGIASQGFQVFAGLGGFKK
jgi:hypothetical protein